MQKREAKKLWGMLGPLNSIYMMRKLRILTVYSVTLSQGRKMLYLMLNSILRQWLT